MKSAAHFSLLTLLLIILTAIMLTPRTFFASDTGLRMIQIDSYLTQNQWTSAAIEYPNEQFDPDYQHIPYYVAYLLHNDALYFNISPLFPLITAVFLAAFGWYGMIAPLIIGAIMIGYGVYVLVKNFEIEKPFLWVWLSVFGTPVAFYTVQIWDHSLAVGFTTLGVAFTAVSLKTFNVRKMMLGGCLIALTFMQRPEAIPFAIGTGLALGLTHYRSVKKLWPFLVGGFVGTAVSAAVNLVWQGTLLGFPFGSNLFKIGVPSFYPAMEFIRSTRPPSTEAIKMGRLLFHINARDPLTFSAALLTLVAILLIFFAFRVPKYQKTKVLWVGLGCLGVAYGLLIFVSAQQPVLGLVSTAPFLPLSLAFVNQAEHNKLNLKQGSSPHQIYSFVFASVLFFILIMLLAWPAFGGRQWGARYLLPAYPLFVFLAGYSVTHFRLRSKRPFSQVVQKVTVGIVIISFIFQSAGLILLYRKLTFDKSFQTSIQALEADVIFTDEPFLHATVGPIEGKQFFFVADTDQLNQLIPVVFDKNIEQIGVLAREPGSLTVPENLSEIQIAPSGAVTYKLSPIE
ncbi:MAG: hypothetical protein AAF490_27630 [Chloroflexota bacterium]